MVILMGAGGIFYLAIGLSAFIIFMHKFGPIIDHYFPTEYLLMLLPLQFLTLMFISLVFVFFWPFIYCALVIVWFYFPNLRDKLRF